MPVPLLEPGLYVPADNFLQYSNLEFVSNNYIGHQMLHLYTFLPKGNMGEKYSRHNKNLLSKKYLLEQSAYHTNGLSIC